MYSRHDSHGEDTTLRFKLELNRLLTIPHTNGKNAIDIAKRFSENKEQPNRSTIDG
ncbi:hypothetical protein [Pseudomonas sp. LB3P14]